MRRSMRLQREKLQPDFDLLDVPRDRFVIAGDAWTQCRAGNVDPSTCGIFDLHGLWFIVGEPAARPGGAQQYGDAALGYLGCDALCRRAAAC